MHAIVKNWGDLHLPGFVYRNVEFSMNEGRKRLVSWGRTAASKCHFPTEGRLGEFYEFIINTFGSNVLNALSYSRHMKGMGRKVLTILEDDD